MLCVPRGAGPAADQPVNSDEAVLYERLVVLIVSAHGCFAPGYRGPSGRRAAAFATGCGRHRVRTAKGCPRQPAAAAAPAKDQAPGRGITRPARTRRGGRPGTPRRLVSQG